MKKNTYLIVIFLIVASCATFGQIAGNDFNDFDDNVYITENNHIKSGINTGSIKWAFTTTHAGYWHPLTWLSHMLDCNLFGADAGYHHLVSLLLHIGAVILLFLFLNKTTNNIWPSAFAAAFFALHPLRVESVAWAAERKDVLSMFFGMATLYAYTLYAKNYRLDRYILCLMLFTFGLMSKPMIVTLPFLLILLDYWPLKRWQKALDKPTKDKLDSVGKLFWEKIPFIFMTIAFSIITFWTQSNAGALPPAELLPLSLRIANAMISYIAYLEKIFWPYNLAIFYPYDFSIPLWKVLISCIILIAITATVFCYIRKLPFLFIGWFWYLGTLIPLIGLVQAGTQAMTDRHTYLPSIGIGIILAWGIPLLFRRKYIRKKILFPTGLTIIAILAFLTWTQCGYWKNSITLFSHAIQVTKDNYLAYSRLGNAYGKIKQYQKAINNFNEAIRIRPDYVIAYNGRGFSYNVMGLPQRAIDEFNKAIYLKPDYADAWNNRAFSYFMLGDKISGCRDADKSCELGVCKTLIAAKVKGYCR